MSTVIDDLRKACDRIIERMERGEKIFCNQPSPEMIQKGEGNITFKAFDTTCGGCRMSWSTISKYFDGWKKFDILPREVLGYGGYAHKEVTVNVGFLKVFAKGELRTAVEKANEETRKKNEKKEKDSQKKKEEDISKEVLSIKDLLPGVSNGQARFVAEYSLDNKIVVQKEQLALVDNLLVISYTKWDTTITTKKSYCSVGGTVTDYAVRWIKVFDLEKHTIIGSKKESHLFRTTQKGVVGQHYDAKIVSAQKNKREVIVTYPYEEVKITIK